MPFTERILVIDTAIPRSLRVSAYGERVKECAQALAAVRALAPEVPTLAAATLEQVERALMPDQVRRRARHVVTENARVLEAVEALRAGALERLGALLAASHRSLRDDFQVSIPDLDRLVALAAEAPGVFGARLTGGGFGGAIVVAARPEGLRTSMERVAERYRAQTQRTATVLVPC